MMSLDWMVYALVAVAVVFLIAMFFKYKKHNRYADKSDIIFISFCYWYYKKKEAK